MTEPAGHAPRKRRKRLSKGALRVWAWVVGGVALLSPSIAFALSPKPMLVAAPPTGGGGRVLRPVVIRKITRRIIVHDARKAAPVHYVYVSAPSSSGGVTAVPAQASAPVTTSTGGSGHP